MTEHQFIEARHVDDLIAAIRGLNITLLRLETLQQRHVDVTARTSTETLGVLLAIAEHTQNLPALVELLKAKTNGNSHHEETAHVRPDHDHAR